MYIDHSKASFTRNLRPLCERIIELRLNRVNVIIHNYFIPLLIIYDHEYNKMFIVYE